MWRRLGGGEIGVRACGTVGVSGQDIIIIIRLNPNNHCYHGFDNTFDYNHFTNSD